MMKTVYHMGDRVEVTVKYHEMSMKSKGVIAHASPDIFVVLDEPIILEPPAYLDFIPMNVYRIDRSHLFIKDKIPRSSMRKLNGNQDSLTSTSYVICGRCKDPVRYGLTYKCPYHHFTCLSHLIPWNHSTNSPDIERANNIITYLMRELPYAGYDECVTRALSHYHRCSQYGYSAALEEKCAVECSGCSGRHMVALQYMHREIARSINASTRPEIAPIAQDRPSVVPVHYPSNPSQREQKHSSEGQSNTVYKQLLERGCSQVEIADAMATVSLGDPVDVELLQGLIMSKRSIDGTPKSSSKNVSSAVAAAIDYYGYQAVKREAYELSKKSVRIFVWDLLTTKKLPLMLTPQQDIRSQMKVKLNQLLNDDDIWMFRVDDQKKGYCVRILPSTSDDGVEGIFPDDLDNNNIVLFRRRAENVSAKCYFEAYAAQVKHNVSLSAKIVRMAETCFAAWRGIRGDGNCYYRSIYFGFLEQLVLMNPRSPDHFDALISSMSMVHYASVMENQQHAAAMQYLRQARDGEIWKTVWDLESVVLDTSTSFDLAMIRACRRLIADYLIMYSDKEINGISIMDMITGYDESITSMKQYCDEFVCQMGVDAEGPLVEMGVLFKIFKCNGCVVLVDRSDDSRVMLCRTECGSVDADNPATIYVMLRPGHYDLLYPRDDITAEKLADLESAGENVAVEKDGNENTSSQNDLPSSSPVRVRVSSYLDAVRGVDITLHGEANDDTMELMQELLCAMYVAHQGSLDVLHKKIKSIFRIPADRPVTLVTDIADCWSIGTSSVVTQRTLRNVQDDDIVYVKVDGILTVILRLEYEDDASEPEDYIVTLDRYEFETVEKLDERLLRCFDVGNMNLRSVVRDIEELAMTNPWRLRVSLGTIEFVLPYGTTVFEQGVALATPQSHTRYSVCRAPDEVIVEGICDVIGATNVELQFYPTEDGVKFCRYDEAIMSDEQRKATMASMQDDDVIVLAVQGIECKTVSLLGDAFADEMPHDCSVVINMNAIASLDELLEHLRVLFHIPDRFALSTRLASLNMISAVSSLEIHVQTVFDVYCNGEKRNCVMDLSSCASFDDLLLNIQHVLGLPRLTSLHSYINDEYDKKLTSTHDVCIALSRHAVLGMAQCMCAECQHDDDKIMALSQCGHYVCQSCINKKLLQHIANLHRVPVANEVTALGMSKLLTLDENLLPILDGGACPCVGCDVGIISEDVASCFWFEDAYGFALFAAEEASRLSRRIRSCCLQDITACDPSDVDEMMQLGCGHFYHPDCLSNYLKGSKDQLLGRGEKFMCLYCKDNDLYCNCPTCLTLENLQPHHINQFDLMSLSQVYPEFTAEDVDGLNSAMYRQHHNENRLHGNRKYIECCEMMYEFDVHERRDTMNCTKCRKAYCTKCCRAAHPDLDCEEALRRYEEEVALKVANEAGIIMQACPQCGTLATKDDKCYHVTCNDCQLDFCFLCAAPREPTLAHNTTAYHRSSCEFAFENVCCDKKCKTEKGMKYCESAKFDPENCSECRRLNRQCEFPPAPEPGSRCKVLVRAEVDDKLV